MELQIAELHFSKSPCCDYSAIKGRAEAILDENLDAPNLQGASDTFLLFHKNHLIKYEDGEIPAQTAILAAHGVIDITAYASEIQQSWGFRGCETILAQSAHTLLVAEMFARGHEPNERIRLFHGVLQAAIENTHPDAIVFKHSQQVVDPRAYLTATTETPINRPGSLNIRFYKVSDADRDLLMDTLGLHAIGLHDLQCHFRKLDPNDVARVLYNAAVYIFENGAIIESGQTIAGVEADSKWVCQFENALVEPARELMDLNPGPLYAAGRRK